ncbi:CdaR family protein [Bacillus spongiae]|uniref:CdaR family protein n=1 Tax=Bacillus spongiae TaxID=2683610 RepID=A0ABU8HJ82_9BACI
MDKLMESRWFMRIVAFALASLLFISVNVDNDRTKTSGNGSNEDSITINDVPITSYYDTENLVVSGLPETVDITLSGTKSLVQTTKARGVFNLFVDLEDVTVGEHNVPIQYKDIPDNLDVIIEPKYIDIDVQEKVTEEFVVEPELNESLLAEGYEIEELLVEPNKVSISGAKSDIEAITYVKASIELNDLVDGNLIKEARVLAFDDALNKLNVTIEPKVVDVKINVVNPSKEVPIKVETKGTLPDGVELDTIEVEPNKIQVFGRSSALNELDELEVEIDLSKIEKDTTLEVPVTLPSGLNKSQPSSVSVNVNVKVMGKRTFLHLPINIRGAIQEDSVTFLSPNDGSADVIVEAYQDILDELTEKDVKPFIDVSDLPPGEHEVDLSVEGLEKVKWSSSVEKVKVKIE